MCAIHFRMGTTAHKQQQQPAKLRYASYRVCEGVGCKKQQS